MQYVTSVQRLQLYEIPVAAIPHDWSSLEDIVFQARIPPLITGAVQPGSTVTVRTWPRSPMARNANDDDPHKDKIFVIGKQEEEPPASKPNTEFLPWHDIWALTLYGRRVGERLYLPIKECNGVESVILSIE